MGRQNMLYGYNNAKGGQMRVTHRHRETRKSKVLNIPSYHIVYPPIDPEKFAVAMVRASETILVGLKCWVGREEAREFGLRVEPQDFPMQLLPYEPKTKLGGET